MTILQVSELEMVRGQRRLISALNWRIDRGEFWCVLGKNGAGKTTLLHALAGLRTPTKGQIQLCGDPLQTTPSFLLARRRGLTLQQQVDVFAHSVFDAVVISRTLKAAAENNKVADDEAVSSALERVGMAGSERRNILTLSGGERQRVALATLLVQSPALMLLDEPVSHQDISQQLQVMRLLRELSAQHAVVASCHDVNLAKRFATHVLVLGEACHWIGKVEDILTPELLGTAFGCQFARQGDWLVPV